MPLPRSAFTSLDPAIVPHCNSPSYHCARPCEEIGHHIKGSYKRSCSGGYLCDVEKAWRGSQGAVHDGQRLQGAALYIDGRLQPHQLMQDAQRALCRLHAAQAACSITELRILELLCRLA